MTCVLAFLASSSVILVWSRSIIARSILRRTTSETWVYWVSLIAPGTLECASSEMYWDSSARVAFPIAPDSTADMISWTCWDDAMCQSVRYIGVSHSGAAGVRVFEPGTSRVIEKRCVGHDGCSARPNVRAKRATTAGRQGPPAENVHRTCWRALVACRWRSA